MSGSSSAWEGAWVAALEEMEVVVSEAEGLLADAHRPVPSTTWSPPVGVGPLPASLEERARALLQRQLAVAGVLSSAMVRGRRHQRALATLAPAPVHPPVYVDVDG